jgi:hypothetical protein
MNTFIETGHAKNVANFEDLISFSIGYGVAYNPSRLALKVPALQTQLTSARTAIQIVKSTKTAFDTATNNREAAFDGIRKLATRIINSLDSTEASRLTVKDARTINRKIQGARAKKIEDEVPVTLENPSATPEIHHISASQQSYDSLIDHMAKLLVLLTAEPLYAPNETDLKVAALNTLLTNMRTTNTAVIDTTTPYRNALIARDTILYQTKTGLVDIAMAVKKYVKSAFGASSSQFALIRGLAFKRISK